MRWYCWWWVVSGGWWWAGTALAQPNETLQVEILNADVLTSGRKDTSQVRKLIGNCVLKQDSILFYSDSIYQFIHLPKFEAYSRVRVVLSDTTTITSREARYEGNERKIHFTGNVVFADGNKTLRTEYLVYDRVLRLAHYPQKGIIQTPELRLESRQGWYVQPNGEAYFARDVQLLNADFTVSTDTLVYSRFNKQTQFVAPTYIHTFQDNKDIYTERGLHDQELRTLFLTLNPFFKDPDTDFCSDTLFLELDTKTGWSGCHSYLQSYKDSVQFYADSLTFNLTDKLYRFYKLPLFIKQGATDTFTISARYIEVAFDSVTRQQEVVARQQVVVHSEAFQAVGDSLYLSEAQKFMYLTYRPVIWLDSMQALGTAIRFWFQESTLDSIHILDKGFIAIHDTLDLFNQLASDTFYVYFKGKKLDRLTGFHKAESIYLMEENGAYTGLNYGQAAGGIRMRYTDNKPSRITYVKNYQSTIYPFSTLTAANKYLPAFRWLPHLRPQGYWKVSNK